MTLRILVIDDRTDIHALLSKVFEDHEVVSALEGTEAQFRMQHDAPFDFVICDWDLGMYDRRNGLEICQHLYDLLENPKPQFIIFSGNNPDLPEDALDHGLLFFTKDDIQGLRKAVLGGSA